MERNHVLRINMAKGAEKHSKKVKRKNTITKQGEQYE